MYSWKYYRRNNNEAILQSRGCRPYILNDGGPIGPGCIEDPECEFVLEGECGIDVTIKFEAPGHISSISQGDVTCTIE